MPTHKTCTACKLLKPLEEFHLVARNKNRRRNQCKLCVKSGDASRYHRTKSENLARAKAWREANPDRKKALARVSDSKAYTKHMLRVTTVKTAAGCLSGCCGWVGALESQDLDFHHIVPHAKSYNVSGMTKSSDAAFVEEVNKCTVLCAICHRRVERGSVIPTKRCHVTFSNNKFSITITTL